MPDRRRKDVMIAFVVVFVFLETAQRLGDIAGDRRLLGNDQSFTHVTCSYLHPARIASKCGASWRDNRQKPGWRQLKKKAWMDGQKHGASHRSRQGFAPPLT